MEATLLESSVCNAACMGVGKIGNTFPYVFTRSDHATINLTPKFAGRAGKHQGHAQEHVAPT